jgi:PKD repeat protein
MNKKIILVSLLLVFSPLVAGEGIAEVTTLDSEGERLSDVRLDVSGATETVAYTDSRGEQEIPGLNNGFHSIEASKPDYNNAEGSFSIDYNGDREEVTLRLSDASDVTGRVEVSVSDQDGNPLDARVEANGPSSTVAYTGGDGFTTIRNLKEGSYTIQASKNGQESGQDSFSIDYQGDVESADLTINTAGDNEPPTADFKYRPGNPESGETVTFDASCTTGEPCASDSDGSIEAYLWDIDGDGDYGDATGVTASKSLTDTTEVGLRVRDDDGAYDTKIRTIEVGGEDNQQPSADFKYRPDNPESGETVTFDASCTTGEPCASDSDGSIEAYLWDIDGDGDYGDESGEMASNSFTETTEVGLRVRDNDGAYDEERKTIEIGDSERDLSITLFEPLDNDRDVNLDPRFTFQGAYGDRDGEETLGFTLNLKQGRNNNPFSSPDRTKTINLPDDERGSITLNNDLEPDTWYSWGIEADHEGETTESEVRKFKTRENQGECSITENDVSLSVGEDTIEEGESTEVEITVTNNGDENQDIEATIELGEEQVLNEENVVPAGGSQTFSTSVSPESDVFVRGQVSTSGDPCGDRVFEPDSKEIVVLGDSGPDNEDPSAEFEWTPRNPVENEEITFDASDSIDSDGNIVSYEWTFGDGASSSGETVTHSYDTEDSYPVQLEVEDDDGATDTLRRYVGVGEDAQQCGITERDISLSISEQTIEQGDSTTLRLRVSNTGSENQRVDVRLELGSQTVLTDTNTVASGASQTFTKQVSPDSDVFARGQVSTSGDPCGDRVFEPDSKEIVVLGDSGPDNEDPSAEFEWTPRNPVENEEITFDAGDSIDPDGNIVSYDWNFGDGSSSSGSQVSHSYNDKGSYPVQLEVEDDDGATDTLRRYVEVGEDAQQCGITVRDVSFTVDEQTINEGESTELNVRVSNTGSENQRVDVRLELGSQTVLTDTNIVAAGGSQSFSTTVSPDSDVFARAQVSTNGDPCGDRDFQTLSKEIIVLQDEDEGNQPPEPDFEWMPQNPEEGEQVSFDAGDSVDSDGSIVSYDWNFGDGSASSGSQVEHIFDDKGEYPVTLTVEDNEGARESASYYINVGEEERRCGVRERNIHLSLEDYTIMNGESTEAELRVYNSGENQDIEVRFKEGSSVINERTLTVPSQGFRTLTQEVSPDRDTFIRAIVETQGEPCGPQEYELVKELVVLQDEEEEAFLDVDVEDQSGSSVQDAEVRVEGPEDRVRFTDRYGSAGFKLEPGDYEVTVTHPEYETQRETVTLYEGDSKDLEFELGRTEIGDGNLQVSVRNQQGRQLDNAEVEVDGPEDRTERTDNDGLAEFRLDSGRYDIEVSKTGYRTEYLSARVYDGETTSRTVRLSREDSQRSLEVVSTDYSSSVCRGRALPVDVTVQNNMDRDEYVTVTGTGLGSVNIADAFVLEEGERKTRTVRFTNVEGSGTEEFRIRAKNGTDDRVYRTVNVENCPVQDQPRDPSSISMKLSYPIPPDKALVGDTVKVSGFVDGVQGRSEVTIDSNGEQKAKVSTQPDGYYQTYVSADEVGTRTVRARSGGKSASRQLEVLPTATVSAITAPRRVFEGETFEVCGQVNSQIQAGVFFYEDARLLEKVNTKGDKCFEVEAQEPGLHTYKIRAATPGESSSSTVSVRVMKTEVEAKSFPNQIASVESGSGMVKVDLYNSHNELQRYNLELKGLPSTWTSQSRKQVVLSPGEGKTEYFYLTPRDEGDYDPEVIIESDNQEVYRQKVDLETGGQIRPRQRSLLDRVTALIPF